MSAELTGGWRLCRLLGVGGMGAVYQAQRANGQRAAVKLLHQHLVADDELACRFAREARVVRHLRHPGVPEVLEVGTTKSGRPFIASELLDGETAAARAERRGDRLRFEEVQQIGIQLLGAVQAMHQSGVLHRDLTPGNLFLTTDEQLKVLDFGIASKRGADSIMGRTIHQACARHGGVERRRSGPLISPQRVDASHQHQRVTAAPASSPRPPAAREHSCKRSAGLPTSSEALRAKSP